MNQNNNKSYINKLRNTCRIIIFGTDTKLGQWFDLILIYAIILSVLTIMLDSINQFEQNYQQLILYIEWFFTILFTIEFGLRIFSTHHIKKYIFSFFGLIDFISIIPSYLSIFFVGSHYLIIIRILRILRIFRVLKLIKYMNEANFLLESIIKSFRKITVFLFFVLVLTVIFGSIMYLVEGAENGFTSIPRSIYWSIVTMTTVGYGDLSPKTSLGQTIAALVMLIGYSVIAVPTGIVSAEFTKNAQKNTNHLFCPKCRVHEDDKNAKYCKFCKTNLM